MNLRQRANMIAQALSQAGVNHTSIIGILNNAIAESAHTLDPKITEYGRATIFSENYAFGCGIWQWSYPSNGNYQVYTYARSHSEQDAILMQVHKLLNEPGQWIPKPGYNFSFSDFLHNTVKMSWQQLTIAWAVCWERPGGDPYEVGADRQAYYSEFMPLDFGSTSGSTGTDTPKPHVAEKKLPTKEDCLSLFRKYKGYLEPNNDDGQGGNNSHSDAGQASSNFNVNAVMNYFNSNKGHLRYSMGMRGQVVNGTYSDCSAFVTYMLKLGYGINYPFLQNTETLHNFLKSNGFKLLESTGGTHLSQPFASGDVFILGYIGTSIGANGHTLIACGGNVLDCHGPDGGLALGIRSYNEFNNQYLSVTKAYWGANNWYVYHYGRR